MSMILKRLSDGAETWSASAGKCTSAEINYFVMFPDSKAAARQAVMLDSPAIYGGLARKEIRFSSYDSDGNASFAVVYGSSDDDNDDAEDEESTMSFECGGGTKHINFSLNQRRAAGTRDAGGAIGWNGKSGSEMQLSGVDVPTAQLRETYTKKMRLSRLTTEYKRTVAYLVGRVNDRKFKGWEPGEVMFNGISYNSPTNNSSKVTVTYNFTIQQNEENEQIGQFLVSKKGWEYVWALSDTQADDGAPQYNVEAVYVDQVCKYGNFELLGL